MVRTRADHKSAALLKLAGNWPSSILCFFVYWAVSMGSGLLPVIGLLAVVLIRGPLGLGYVGSLRLFRSKVESGGPSVELIFAPFRKNYGHYFWVSFRRAVYIVLGLCLLIVPGMIAALKYSLVGILVWERPDLSARDLMAESARLMYGHKWRLLKLLLSFSGWAILCLCTLGLGFFVLAPYVAMTWLEFVDDIMPAGRARTAVADPLVHGAQ